MKNWSDETLSSENIAMKNEVAQFGLPEETGYGKPSAHSARRCVT